MPKKPAGRLQIEMPWQDAAGKLLATPAKSMPPRARKPRKPFKTMPK